MKNEKSKSILRIIKKLFFVIFLLHTGWFLYFIVQKFYVVDFPIANLKSKVLTVCGIIVAISLLYYLWLRRINFIRKAGIFFSNIFFICYTFFFTYLLLSMVFNPPITITQLHNVIQGNGLKRYHISYHDMGSNIKLAVIASEDQLFPDHDGFDLKAIKKAIKYNNNHSQKQRGGSTLSQQTAKNVFLWQGGGFLRKGMEVYITFSIEKCWTKKIILERYLNIAEMGRGIFGIQAAAKTYFNKDAKNLTRTEAAQIAACLPNPKRLLVKPLSAYVAARASAIEKQMAFLEGDKDIQEIIN